MRPFARLSCAAAVASLVLSACATAPAVTAVEPDAIGREVKAPRESISPLSEPDRAALSCIALDPVQVTALVTPGQAAGLSRDLRANLVSALTERRIRVEPTEAGCAHLASTVTGVVKSNVVGNVVFGVVLLPVLPFNGAVRIEAELRDPAGRSIAALRWAKTGSPFSIVSGLSETGQARALTKDFSGRFARLLVP